MAPLCWFCRGKGKHQVRDRKPPRLLVWKPCPWCNGTNHLVPVPTPTVPAADEAKGDAA